MKYIFTSLLLCVGLICRAQTVEVGYSPITITGWGKLQKTTKFDVSIFKEAFQTGKLRYLPGIRYTRLISNDTNVGEFGGPLNGNYTMYFVVPASFGYDLGTLEAIGRFGAGLSDKQFPNKNGLKLNFLLEGGFQYFFSSRFSIALLYSHISNGYRGKTNPATDNIGVTAGLSF
jgi:hypothetical protein